MFKSTGYWFSLSILKMNQCRTWREAIVCSIQARVAMRRDVATVALTPGAIAPEMCEPDTPRCLSALASVSLLLSEKHEIMM